MVEEASTLRAEEAGAKGFFRGGLFGMVGVSLMAVLWVGGSRVGDGSMTVSGSKKERARYFDTEPMGQGRDRQAALVTPPACGVVNPCVAYPRIFVLHAIRLEIVVCVERG